MHHTIGISEMTVTDGPEDVLVTYSLGSCMGLALYDPAIRAGGMIHCVLPLSRIDLQKAAANPAMFTDTGVSALLQEMFNRGADRGRIVATVAGGGSLLDEKGLFRIGERNYAVLRKMLWKNNILIKGEDVGGTTPRTMYLYMATGKTLIKSNGRSVEL